KAGLLSSTLKPCWILASLQYLRLLSPLMIRNQPGCARRSPFSLAQQRTDGSYIRLIAMSLLYVKNPCCRRSLLVVRLASILGFRAKIGFALRRRLAMLSCELILMNIYIETLLSRILDGGRAARHWGRMTRQSSEMGHSTLTAF